MANFFPGSLGIRPALWPLLALALTTPLSLRGGPRPGTLLEYEKNNIRIYNRVVPSVVNVSTFQQARSWEYGTVEVPRGGGDRELSGTIKAISLPTTMSWPTPSAAGKGGPGAR